LEEYLVSESFNKKTLPGTISETEVARDKIEKLILSVFEVCEKNQNGGKEKQNLDDLIFATLQTYDSSQLGKSFGLHDEKASNQNCQKMGDKVNLQNFNTIRPLANSQILCNSTLQQFIQVITFTVKFYFDYFSDKFISQESEVGKELKKVYFKFVGEIEQKKGSLGFPPILWQNLEWFQFVTPEFSDNIFGKENENPLWCCKKFLVSFIVKIFASYEIATDCV
jgi:hypothetical protein